jgi:hypothetical protein
MDRFLYSGYSFETYQDFLIAPERARIRARDLQNKKNWDRHFKKIIQKTLEKIN